jgi:hypothetical protein
MIPLNVGYNSPSDTASHPTRPDLEIRNFTQTVTPSVPYFLGLRPAEKRPQLVHLDGEWSTIRDSMVKFIDSATNLFDLTNNYDFLSVIIWAGIAQSV